MDFSIQHLTAFRRWQHAGMVLDDLDNDDLNDLLEDPNFIEPIRRERARRAAPPTAPTTRQPAARQRTGPAPLLMPLDAWADVIADAITAATAPLRKEIEALKQRGSMSYRGVYEHGRAYGVGDAVTFQGSLWIAHAPTTARPDEPREPRAWQLCVKKGRDGRDGKDLR